MKWVDGDVEVFTLNDDVDDVDVDSGGVIPNTITHNYYVYDAPNKLLLSFRKLLPRLINSNGSLAKMLIFCREDRPLQEIADITMKDLVDANVNVLTGSLSSRAAAITDFDNNDNRVKILFATPKLASRGLDLVDVSHVVNFDFHQDATEYVHRAGRTGRNGRDGVVVNLVSEKEEFRVQRIENECRCTIDCKGRQKKKKKIV